MMVKAVQQFMLGKVLGSEDEARNTLQKIKASGYDGIELCHFMIHKTPFWVRLLTRAAGMPTGKGGSLDWPSLVQEAGLQVPALHMDLKHLEQDVASAVKEAQAFNTKYLVITGMYRFDYGSETAVRALAERLNQVGKQLKEQGVSLLYHNHNCELMKVNPRQTALDILMAATHPDHVNFEFDSYWFAEAGADPLTWMKRLDNRLKLWHINDRGSRHSGPLITPILKSDSLELGTGNMPLESLLEQALSVGVEAVILESHRNWIDQSPVKSMQLSAEYLNRRL